MVDGHSAAVHALRESWFWSGVMHDHAEFIFTSLPPDQVQAARWASGFKQTLERLHGEILSVAAAAGIVGPAGAHAVTGPPAEAPLAGFDGKELAFYEQRAQQLTRAVLEASMSIRGFKEQLLQQKLDCTIQIGLGPSLLAHMIVEAEEAVRALSGAREDAPLPPALESLHHHLIWLPDASGHAAALHNGLDGVEHRLRGITHQFQEIFDGMHIKALELRTMLRVAPRMVGALRRFNRDSVARIRTFRDFLTELREHLEGCAILGTLMPLFADHMLREELYYMEKIMAIPAE